VALPGTVLWKDFFGSSIINDHHSWKSIFFWFKMKHQSYLVFSLFSCSSSFSDICTIWILYWNDHPPVPPSPPEHFRLRQWKCYWHRTYDWNLLNFDISVFQEIVFLDFVFVVSSMVSVMYHFDIMPLEYVCISVWGISTIFE